MSQAPHKPTKRKPKKNGQAPHVSEAQTSPVRGKHARIDDSVSKSASTGEKEPAPKKTQASKERTSKAHASKGFSRGKKILLCVGLAVIACALVIGMMVFSARNDVQDVQGTWQIQSSQATITITDHQIVLTDDVAYNYSIDPWAHTLDLDFFGATGIAQYAFDSERNKLVITEHSVNEEGETVDNVVTLTRVSADSSSDASSE